MANNLDAVTDFANLFGSIDKQQIYGLGLSVPESARDVFKPWDQRDDTSKFVESGVDDQLIIHVAFNESVRIKSIFFKIGRGEVAPQHLDIFTNHPTIVDFSDAENIKPQLSIALQTGESDVVEYPVRVATFPSVTTLSLFFKDSEGGDTSRVYYIGFKGDIRSARTPASSGLEVPAEGSAEAQLLDRIKSRIGGTSQQTTAR